MMIRLEKPHEGLQPPNTYKRRVWGLAFEGKYSSFAMPKTLVPLRGYEHFSWTPLATGQKKLLVPPPWSAVKNVVPLKLSAPLVLVRKLWTLPKTAKTYISLLIFASQVIQIENNLDSC